jgi:predicted DNA-binding transcriptional regulator AlpA
MSKQVASPVLEDDRLITEDEVNQRVPMHRVTRYRNVREGTFPAPIWISANRRMWRLSAILAWIAEREQNPAKARRYFNVGKATAQERAAKRLVSGGADVTKEAKT